MLAGGGVRVAFPNGAILSQSEIIPREGILGTESLQGFLPQLLNNGGGLLRILGFLDVGQSRSRPSLLIGGEPPAHTEAVLKSDGVFQHGETTTVGVGFMEHDEAKGIHPMGEVVFVVGAVIAWLGAVDSEGVKKALNIHKPLI